MPVCYNNADFLPHRGHLVLHTIKVFTGLIQEFLPAIRVAIHLYTG